MLSGVDTLLNTDYLERKEEFNNMANNIIYSGPIDAYFDYKFGKLNYRSLKFEIEILILKIIKEMQLLIILT